MSLNYPALEPVTVLHRTGQRCRGVRTSENVIAYDMDILPDWQVPGRPTRDRCVVIVAEGVQFTQPVTFTGALEGAWYIDLVTVVDRGAECEIRDCFVDLMVFPDEQRYEVLDLDELGDALASGSIDSATAVSVLRNAQRFVERRLGGTRSHSSAVWPQFPPASVGALFELPDLGGWPHAT